MKPSEIKPNNVRVEFVDIASIKSNEKNPRTITEYQFKKLVKSIKEFPAMLEIRPIVIDDQNIIIGGNMRFEAVKKLGWKRVPIVRAEWLTDAQKIEFMIRDNTHSGVFDYDVLSIDFDVQTLDDWNVPVFEMETNSDDDDDGNDDAGDSQIKINLKYEPSTGIIVRDALNRIHKNPSIAVAQLLKIIEPNAT